MGRHSREPLRALTKEEVATLTHVARSRSERVDVAGRTSSDLVRRAALDYANHKVSTLGTDWVSLSRPDGEANWEIDFEDLAAYDLFWRNWTSIDRCLNSVTYPLTRT